MAESIQLNSRFRTYVLVYSVEIIATHTATHPSVFDGNIHIFVLYERRQSACVQ